MEKGKYFVRLVPFPVPNGGMVIPNDDDTYSVYINKNLPPEKQREALRHELRHINENDFQSDKAIQDIELIS